MNKVLFPEVSVQLSGDDGNAFFIMGKVTKAMAKAGVDERYRKRYLARATAALNYEEFLQITKQTVNVK